MYSDAMKRLLLLTCFSLFALAQQSGSNLRHGEWWMSSNSQERDGSVVHLRGNVRIETDSVIVRADDIDYNVTSHVIQAHGDATITVK